MTFELDVDNITMGDVSLGKPCNCSITFPDEEEKEVIPSKKKKRLTRIQKQALYGGKR